MVLCLGGQGIKMKELRKENKFCSVIRPALAMRCAVVYF